MSGGGGIADGLRHLRSEWGRWWRAEDLTDTHIAHRILNDQYRLWRQLRQRVNSEVQQNLTLLKQQQKQQTYMQMQRMQVQKRSRGHGYGGYGFGGMGASPMISYRMMQWAQLQIKIGQEEFRHLEVTPGMLQIGRGQVRSRRHLAAAAWIVALPVLWVGLWWISALAGLVVTALTTAVFTVLAWAQGRRPTRRRPPVPKLLFVPPAPPAHTELAEDAEPEPEPFPIREAGRDPKRTQEAVRLALRKERAQIAEVVVPTETDWGWSVRLILSGGTLGDLVRLLPAVATTLRVGPNRLLAQLTSAEDSADITLRILTSDPFAAPLPYPQRAPASCSITQAVSLGLSIEGETTPVVLAGQHVIVVGDTGSGKTAMVQAIAEYVTACRDAVIVDIDPVKRGLKALGPMAVMTARTPEEAEAALKSLLERVKQRIASMPPIQDMWEPTPDAPAVIVVIDEYTMLTSGGKEAAIDILRTGREAMITLVILTQDATSPVLGDAIADAFGVRILMPCRAADVPVTIGRADAISQGWLPHLLVPSPEKDFPADAGRFYCITPRHRHPMLRYVSPLPPAEADRRTRERVTAGLPRLETPALIATLPSDAPQILRLLLKAFAAHGNPEYLTLTQLADHFAAADPATWGKWNGRPNRLLMVGRTMQSHLRQAELDIQSTRLNHEEDPKRPAVYRLADIQRALS
ncbi:ATP-binding protein [Streptomyces sp. ME19-01-6]|uniref:ATP-binding protein n=1 Tax=Streptomyces sp. ME19-01-6 TaxID=3028686 RepID=UPI0029B1610F|nr:ATP-binding protein [Streptomyces sp. ME19-01-6]MDX3232496.1 ATP-binding protein [Streptomyces sp. ME19-01-6]